MKKFDLKNIRFGKVDLATIDDRMLLLNLYITQLLTLALGLIIILLQKHNKLLPLFDFASGWRIVLWGVVFGLAVLGGDMLISRWVPKEITDDGGINKMIFAKRPLWHIAVISLVVAICEELLFRGAVQYMWGPYWTSIVFAAIHVRYLQHWLMTGMVFAISYGLGWIYIHTGTLWTPIAAHFVIDFTMGCVLRYGKEE
ncbi:CPBP family intramembrane metalloprotease [Paenibacillus athensensis]|uniref:CPBP family intramembrane metalloprotease n=1 Tax=Paenibacillus athensensis TaxID=1967502 RepID=A0A4Y8Q8T9_9BACL|nr:CPBP family intramembrane glutamic endopeptidase [Paenibacillus athensensis]MCD1260182.1 CPBP family intramembrane metalloprotease [Paenibacillus athensensis]